MFKGIDLYSDTITRPSLAMRQAMMNAEVGDEQMGEDPTTIELENRAAELLGKTGALFFPSAAMANEVAILLHCRPGEELLAADHCHLFFAESGGPAFHARVMTRSIPTTTGVFTGEQLRSLCSDRKGPHYPQTRLVSVENTTNMGGGVPWSRSDLQSVVSTAKSLGLLLHMDGARLFSASVATGMSPAEIANGFDSVTLCFSKGLGCPAGALLAFPKEKWNEVRRLKQLMGGSLRQSGILAAGALFALENNVSRLKEDHENARRLASGLSKQTSIQVETTQPQTNMVFFRWMGDVPVARFREDIEKAGLRFSSVGGNRLRAVTHMDVSASQIDEALKILSKIISGYKNG